MEAPEDEKAAGIGRLPRRLLDGLVELTAPRAVTGSTGGRVRLTLELVGAAEAAEPSKAAGTAS